MVGILVRKKFLNIVKKQNAVARFLDIVIPLVYKPIVVYSINHRQLSLFNDAMLIKVVTDNLCQDSLSCTCLTYDNGIDGKTNIGNILS